MSAPFEVRIERDPSFWLEVATHPEVAPRILRGQDPAWLANLVRSPLVAPIAAPHGGFLFRQLDGLAFTYELHTLFTPEGWGREVAQAARQAFDHVFESGAHIVHTLEQTDWWRSRPPKTHGWRPCAPGRETPFGPMRAWMLTADAWNASPVGRRVAECRS